MTEAERIENAFLVRTSFKNVSGNWQFNGDMTPHRALKILQQIKGPEQERLVDECIEKIQKYFDKADMDIPSLLLEMITSIKNENRP